MSKVTIKFGQIETVVWTAIRQMMLDTKNVDRFTEYVRRLSVLMPKIWRDKEVLDIRRNIQWNGGRPESVKAMKAWGKLADWLERGEVHKKSLALPRTRVSQLWMDLIYHSIAYGINGRTYACVAANEIAGLLPILNYEQRFMLYHFMHSQIRPTDDKEWQMLMAALNPEGQASVTVGIVADEAKMMAKQLRGCDIKADIVVLTDRWHCFKYDDQWVIMDDYVMHGTGATCFREEAIVSIDMMPQDITKGAWV